MRRYGLYDTTRGLTTALAAGLAGLALWGATQIGTQTPSRFWLAMLVVAGGGFVLALAMHVGSWTKGLRLVVSPGTFVLGFLPVLVCVGWILLATQPAGGWEHGNFHSWSASAGILGVVHSVGLWQGVLAFGFGVVLGFCFDGVPAPAADVAPYEAPAATAATPVVDEPVAAERSYAGDGMRAPETRVPERTRVE